MSFVAKTIEETNEKIRQGKAVVLTAGGEEFKVISRINMEDKPVHGSIAIANGCLFIHTAEKLTCIAKK